MYPGSLTVDVGARCAPEQRRERDENYDARSDRVDAGSWNDLDFYRVK